ncbi:hypothetical protein CY0110_17017 [Crocosphaera chwakensis CCY0110]|uniref:Uncharacterized protein n=1 Tax=Crocosphaera chwakensis CCY0110 TaxID=391612 RepID=A3II85_9CHRO|nr:hypothetical protein CY0110_17017 [Crocosphaera chwakensis CCY0110]
MKVVIHQKALPENLGYQEKQYFRYRLSYPQKQ